jgi:hypothetical protein
MNNTEAPKNPEQNPQGLMISNEERETLIKEGVVTIKLYPRKLKNIYPEFQIGQTIEFGEPIGRPNQIDLSDDNPKAKITNIVPLEKKEFNEQQIEVTFILIK